jgi:hypothetical protein
MSKKLAEQTEDHTLVNTNASLLQKFKNLSTMAH